MSDLISRCKLFNSLAKVQTLGEAYAVIQGMEAEDLTSRIADLEQEDYELYCSRVVSSERKTVGMAEGSHSGGIA